MDQQTMTMQCARCKKTNRMLDMVVDASKRGMVCRTCAGLPPKSSPRAMPATERTIANVTKPSTVGPTGRSRDTPGRNKYACTACNYRFGSSKDKTNLHCPYCGSASVENDLKSSAQALISSSLGRGFD